MEQQIVAYSEKTKDPVLALFLRPDHFAEDIAIASVLYLGRTTMRKVKGMDAALFIPVEVELTRVNAERIYFHEQQKSSGEKFRRTQLTYDVACKSRTAGIRSARYYSAAESGELVSEIPDGPADRKLPKPGSLGDIVMKGV